MAKVVKLHTTTYLSEIQQRCYTRNVTKVLFATVKDQQFRLNYLNKQKQKNKNKKRTPKISNKLIRVGVISSVLEQQLTVVLLVSF